MKRLQNIVNQYKNIYIDDINFNENTFEIEVDLFNNGYIQRKDFIKDCDLIRKELEENNYRCTYDDDFSEFIYMLYIFI